MGSSIVAVFLSQINGFFPFIKRYQIPCPRRYPITTIQKLCLEFLSSQLEVIPLIIIISCITSWILTGNTLFSYFAVMSFVFSLLNLNFRQLLSLQVRQKTLLLTSNVFFCLGLLFTIHNSQYFLFSAFFMLAIVLLREYLIRVGYAKNYSENAKVIAINIAPSHQNLFFDSINLTLRNKYLRLPFLIAFFLKTFILVIGIIEVQRHNEFLFDSKIIFYLYSGPLVYFTYALNNFFGFFPFFLYNTIRTGSTKLVLNYIITFYFTVLFCDLSLSFLPMVILDALTIEYVASYFSMSLVLSAIGIPGSFIKTKKIRHKESGIHLLKNQTSILITVLSVSSVVLIVYINVILMLPAFLSIFILVLLYVRKKKSMIKYLSLNRELFQITS